MVYKRSQQTRNSLRQKESETSLESDVLNAHDAASFLGVHVETLRKLARRNEIPCFKIGRDWRFRKGALLSWAEEQRPNNNIPSVLILDDEVKVCRTLARIVERIGCSTRCATDGTEGLELVLH